MFETFKDFLVRELGIKADAIKLDAELSADLGINSLELADLIYKCEETFGVEIDDEIEGGDGFEDDLDVPVLDDPE